MFEFFGFELSGTVYLVIKALHIISIISWMAGLLYLPRLFVYHCEAEVGSEKSETFKIMERRLLKAIMNPAMIASYLFGILMLLELWDSMLEMHWLHVKLVLVLLMTVIHMHMGKWQKNFEADRNTRTHKFYRMMNEVPTVLMIGIVFLVIVQPF